MCWMKGKITVPYGSVLRMVPSFCLIIHIPAHSNSAALDVVEQYATYEDYLDAQVTETDMYFLQVDR